MMTDIKFSPEALNDLIEIKSYITNEIGSAASAQVTIDNIIKRIRQLKVFPEMGAPLKAIINIDTSYRYLVCGNYMTFYQLDNEYVYIIRVLYGKRNFMQILFK